MALIAICGVPGPGIARSTRLRGVREQAALPHIRWHPSQVHNLQNGLGNSQNSVRRQTLGRRNRTRKPGFGSNSSLPSHPIRTVSLIPSPPATRVSWEAMPVQTPLRARNVLRWVNVSVTSLFSATIFAGWPLTVPSMRPAKTTLGFAPHCGC